MDYRSRWQQRRQERLSRQRLIAILAVIAVAIAGVALVATRGVHGRPGYALASPGLCWVTPGPGMVLVCQREGRLVRLTPDLSDQGTGWARPFTQPAGFTGRAALTGGLAIVSCGDARLRAVELVTGVQSWETLVGGAAAEPTVAGSEVFFGADDGKLYAVKTDDGAVEWSVLLGARIASAPLVTDDCVLVGTVAGLVQCVRRADGGKLWRATLGGPVYASPRQFADGVVIGCDDAKLYRIGPDGQVVGSFEMPGLIRAPAAVAGDAVVVGDTSGVVCRIDASDMSQVWRRRLGPSVQCAPVIDGDRVWCPAGRTLACLSLATGHVLWRTRTRAQITDCAIEGGTIYWTTDAGCVLRRVTGR